ncbi:MAG: pyridoxamine 5'-phosphate oxidase family protein [bacterium]|nr:pyridoxamine 5'-phosphate oxidase family protein [Acidimicrobiia bacterium]MCY4650427.1 pyridoxamine 5'-phosphate oxidase family protein [bacterium]
MGSYYQSIPNHLATWIEDQPMFFVATAPSGEVGHINLSPKGLDTFRIVDSRTVAYLDLVGSGAETIAHLRQNGRIVVMFCGFDQPRRILRIWGEGSVLYPGSQGHSDLALTFPDIPGSRSIIRVDVQKVGTSCGGGVPLMEMVSQRDFLPVWAEKKGPDAMWEYQKKHNTHSLDGLPAMDFPAGP